MKYEIERLRSHDLILYYVVNYLIIYVNFPRHTLSSAAAVSFDQLDTKTCLECNDRRDKIKTLDSFVGVSHQDLLYRREGGQTTPLPNRFDCSITNNRSFFASQQTCFVESSETCVPSLDSTSIFQCSWSSTKF